MKKTTLLIFVSCLGFMCMAQGKFQLGLQLSPNLSWMNPDSEGVDGEGSKIGFGYGIIADFNIADNYAISTGISLLNIGGKLSYPDIQSPNLIPIGGRTEADIRLKYVQIPFTLKLKTNQIGYMKYFGQFGLGLGINYDAEADTDFNSPSIIGSTFTRNDADFGDEINLFRGSLIVGLGAEYNISGNTSIMLGLTFDNGFTNLLSEDTYEADGSGNAIGNRDQDFKAISNIFVINAGVLF